MEKVAIITGGSAGIGAACVDKLIVEGYMVYNLDVQPSTKGEFVECDVSCYTTVQACVHDIIAVHAHIDALVCNAGVHLSANIEETSPQDLERLFNLNVKGAYALIQAALPAMKEKGGAIVLMASDQALIGKPRSFAYNLTKAALASIARTTALDYASYKIRANAVCPGTIETPLYHKAIDLHCHKTGKNKEVLHSQEVAMQPLHRLGQPEEVADLVNFLLSDQASFITGGLQTIDGGYTTR